MASAATETTPLVAGSGGAAAAGGGGSGGAPVRRTVTFSPDTRLGTSPSESVPRTSQQPAQQTQTQTQTQPVLPGQPILSSLNSKIRRRNSHGAPISGAMTAGMMLPSSATSKIGPQRTTKKAQKLKLLPDPEHGEDGPDEESGRDVYSQFTRIKDPSARRDAARLGKADRDRLPRVTAYCTASSYRMDGLVRFLKGRAKTRGAVPKQFDECIYTPYDYGKKSSTAASGGSGGGGSGQEDGGSLQLGGPSMRESFSRRKSDSALVIGEGRPIDNEALRDSSEEDRFMPSMTGGSAVSDLPSSMGTSLAVVTSDGVDLDTKVHTPEVFLFEYGTVVIWGMTLLQEKRFLKDIAKFETEKLSTDDIQTENFNFYYTSEYQARIYNDFISLRDKRNYMTKLAISHALAQSVKTSLYEDLLSTTIEETTPFPTLLAHTGSISLSRREINQKIGELFILRINIHLQGSVLDSPELMWAEPQLEPIYGAVRSYLEMDQRVNLMNERLSVLGDLLAVLKDQVGTKHGEYLEWIVIVLIAAEILVAAINIVVDLYAGVD